MGSRREVREAHLLNVAAQRFASAGYRQTALQEITRQADGAKASTYRYFENKQALLAKMFIKVATTLASFCRKTRVFSYLPTATRGYKISIRSIATLSPTEADMIIDRYERPVEGAEPTVSDPMWYELEGIVADPQLLALVQQDLRRHYSPSPYGRPAVPVEVLLRLPVLRRVKRWSYRQAEQEVRESPPYRWWVRVYDRRVPAQSPLND